MDVLLKRYSLLENQNVPRETFQDFESFISMLINENQKINIISKKNAMREIIRDRHIVDSAQVIDFIDLNSEIITDIGTGGGMPGIIISIIAKNMKKRVKLNLYEKSHYKSAFLRKVSRDLNLNTEVLQKNIFEEHGLESGTIVARAFKPLPIVLELVHKNFSNYKNLILFMGKNGEKILNDTLKDWAFDFEKKKELQVKIHYS